LSPIAVVGLHGGEAFGASARTALGEAQVVVGSARHLDAVATLGGSSGPTAGSVERIELAGAIEPLLDRIAERRARGRAVVVLASGDPGFFGIVRVLAQRFGPDALAVHPAPSSVALAFARLGRSWEDALVVSAHGRPFEPSARLVSAAPKVAVLTAPDQPPQAVGARLLELGCGPREVVIATRLGEPHEELIHTDLPGLAGGTFDPMSVVLLLDPAAPAPDGPTSIGGGVDPARPDPRIRQGWGLPESEFDHRAGLITKAEVRAVALGHLALPRSGVLWDVGAGSGAVGIECARLQPDLRVIAVERGAEDAARIEANAARHGVRIEVVRGSAPEALAGLPAPDRVFVGGGGPAVLRAALGALRPGGIIVATHVLVDRATDAWALLGNLTQVAANRAVPIAQGFRLEAQNPVFVTWGEAPG
jgi:precorrin-6Y C5,15-methyltransferase (decarboxylating)